MRDDITFIKGQGASGRQAAGEDFISGLVLYGAKPAGFPSGGILKCYSPIDAENVGITNTYSDSNAATSTYTVPAIPAIGTTIQIKVQKTTGEYVLVSDVYVTKSTDTTVGIIAGNITQLINNQSYLTGYSAGYLAGLITVYAPKNLGLAANTLMLNVFNSTVSGGAPVQTTFSGGTGSKLAVWHYHIAEFFRGNPSGQLFVGIFAVPSTYDFSEITTMKSFANGKLRQVGVFKDAIYSNADLIAIDLEIKTNNDVYHAPLSALYAGDLTRTADITTVPDLSFLSANKATSIIGQDGGALGAQLYGAYGKSITQLGIALGLLSLSSVSEDFGNVIDKFNLSNGTENDVPAFANGQLLSALSSNALDAIDAKRHVFGQKYVGNAGTYFNDNHTSIAISSDYAYINDNRVIDKACREIYSTVLPTLKGRLLKNADGTLATSTINYISGLALKPLYQMQRDGDLSVVSKSDVYIDPTQNVTMTSKLVINVVLNEDGIARNISIPISFK